MLLIHNQSGHERYTILTYPVPFPSRMKGYFKINHCATNLQKCDVGFSTKPYICVTKSRDISFRMSGVRVSDAIACMIEGLHLDGIEKLGGIVGEGTLLALDTATVDPEESERLGEGGLQGVRASPCRGECNCELGGMTSVEQSSLM